MKRISTRKKVHRSLPGGLLCTPLWWLRFISSGCPSASLGEVQSLSNPCMEESNSRRVQSASAFPVASPCPFEPLRASITDVPLPCHPVLSVILSLLNCVHKPLPEHTPPINQDHQLTSPPLFFLPVFISKKAIIP